MPYQISIDVLYAQRSKCSLIMKCIQALAATVILKMLYDVDYDTKDNIVFGK
jgi:hypothetical protein